MAATCVCNLHQLMRGEGHDMGCPEGPAPWIGAGEGPVRAWTAKDFAPRFQIVWAKPIEDPPGHLSYRLPQSRIDKK